MIIVDLKLCSGYIEVSTVCLQFIFKRHILQLFLQLTFYIHNQSEIFVKQEMKIAMKSGLVTSVAVLLLLVVVLVLVLL